MKNISVVRKSNGEEVTHFPNYGKHNHVVHYGYLVLTNNLQVLFFYHNDDEISLENVTHEYHIVLNPEP